MFYQLYELNHAFMAPFRASADALNLAWKNPLNPWSHTVVGRSFSAGFEVFERVTRRYGKPAFDLPTTTWTARPSPSRKRSCGASPSAT